MYKNSMYNIYIYIMRHSELIVLSIKMPYCNLTATNYWPETAMANCYSNSILFYSIWYMCLWMTKVWKPSSDGSETMKGDTAEVSASSMLLITIIPPLSNPSSASLGSSFILASFTALTSNLGKLRPPLLEGEVAEEACESVWIWSIKSAIQIHNRHYTYYKLWIAWQNAKGRSTLKLQKFQKSNQVYAIILIVNEKIYDLNH